MRISLQPAFILHHRPYRETSVLLDVLTAEFGWISLVARGVRTQRSRSRALLQPFVPLLVSWRGKGELLSMESVEANGAPLQLRGDCLLSGFYLNELLIKVLQKSDPHPRLYTIYHHTLLELLGPNLKQQTLRLFEKNLLQELGYALQLQMDFSTGEALQAERLYQYYPEQGFKQVEQGGFKGKSLLALAGEQFDDDECLREIKHVMRLALASLLGYQPLQSRKLFK